MTSHDFRHDAGPYVLGALDEPDRVAFASHLADCPDCRDEVARLDPVVAMLRTVSASDAGSIGDEVPPAAAPDTLLPGLLERAARRTRRRRALLGAVGAVAAAAVIALTVVLAGQAGGTPPAAAAGTVTMTPVGGAPVSATATLTSMPWGTEITLHCRYRAVPAEPGYPTDHPATYSLKVTDASGHGHELGSWTLAGGQQATFTGGTALQRGQIRGIEVLAADGSEVLVTAG